jgi:hypothetical protein
MRYLIPGLIQYARAFLLKGHSGLQAQLAMLNEIFKQVLQLRLDESAYLFLNTLLLSTSWEQLSPHLHPIFVLILTRIQNDKTVLGLKQPPVAFARGLLLFLSLFLTRYGLGALMGCLEQIQHNILSMLLNSVVGMLRDVQGLSPRKEVAVAFSRLILEVDSFAPELLKPVLEGTIALVHSHGFRGPIEGEGDDLQADNMQRMKYQQLHTAMIQVRFVLSTHRTGTPATRV